MDAEHVSTPVCRNVMSFTQGSEIVLDIFVSLVMSSNKVASLRKINGFVHSNKS